jgi:hypothetical protein
MKALVKVSLKNGIIAGGIGSLLLAGLYFMGRHPFLIPVFLDFRIILLGVFIFFTLKEIRDYYHGGILYFWQGLVSAFIFTVSFALISSSVVLVLCWLVPEFLSSYVSLSIAQLRSLPQELIDNIGPEVYDRNLRLLPATKGSDLALLYFWQTFMISLFLSIILSVILRRQPKI